MEAGKQPAIQPVIVQDKDKKMVPIKVFLNETSQKELKQLATTGKLSNNDTFIDIGFYGEGTDADYEKLQQWLKPSSNVTDNAVFHVYSTVFQEAAKQTIAALDTNDDGVISLEGPNAEAPGLKKLYENTKLDPDLDGNKQLNRYETAIWLANISQWTEVPVTLRNKNGSLNWRINNTVIAKNTQFDYLDYMATADRFNLLFPEGTTITNEILEAINQHGEKKMRQAYPGVTTNEQLQKALEADLGMSTEQWKQQEAK